MPALLTPHDVRVGTELLFNGMEQQPGSIAARLLANNMDVNCLRPWVGKDGRSYRLMFNGFDDNGQPKYRTVLSNNLASLTRGEWEQIDSAIIEAGQLRLTFVQDLIGRGLVRNLTNGFGKSVYEYNTMTRPGRASIAMDPIRRGERDRPEFGTAGIPLPCIFSEFSFTARELAMAREAGFGGATANLDTRMAEFSSEAVSIEVEKLALGLSDYNLFAYANYTIYGLGNHPNRNTKTMTLPTALGWTPATLISEILSMRKQAKDDFAYGPFILYTSLPWDEYLDNDYSAAYGGATLRERLLKIPDIQEIKTVDYFGSTGYRMVLVQASRRTVQMVVAMPLRTFQWEEEGGLEIKFKIVTIVVPQFTPDPNGNLGIVDGVAA